MILLKTLSDFGNEILTAVYIVIGIYGLFMLGGILNIIFGGSDKKPEPEPYVYVYKPSPTRKMVDSKYIHLSEKESHLRITLEPGFECDYECDDLSLSGLDGFKCNGHLERLGTYNVRGTIKDTSSFYFSYYNKDVRIYYSIHKWVYE